MYNLTDKRNAIRELQRYLLEISYAEGGLTHLAADGIYGEETRAVVSAFQRRNGLAATGEADPETWAEIYRQFEAARRARQGRLLLLPRDALPLSLHARGSEVMLLQTILLALREEMSEIPPLSQTAHFDAQTQRALRAYQMVRRLPPSGILDEETWAHLVRDYERHPRKARDAR